MAQTRAEYLEMLANFISKEFQGYDASTMLVNDVRVMLSPLFPSQALRQLLYQCFPDNGMLYSSQAVYDMLASCVNETFPITTQSLAENEELDSAAQAEDLDVAQNEAADVVNALAVRRVEQRIVTLDEAFYNSQMDWQRTEQAVKDIMACSVKQLNRLDKLSHVQNNSLEGAVEDISKARQKLGHQLFTVRKELKSLNRLLTKNSARSDSRMERMETRANAIVATLKDMKSKMVNRREAELSPATITSSPSPSPNVDTMLKEILDQIMDQENAMARLIEEIQGMASQEPEREFELGNDTPQHSLLSEMNRETAQTPINLPHELVHELADGNILEDDTRLPKNEYVGNAMFESMPPCPEFPGLGGTIPRASDIFDTDHVPKRGTSTTISVVQAHGTRLPTPAAFIVAKGTRDPGDKFSQTCQTGSCDDIIVNSSIPVEDCDSLENNFYCTFLAINESVRFTVRNYLQVALDVTTKIWDLIIEVSRKRMAIIAVMFFTILYAANIIYLVKLQGHDLPGQAGQDL